MIPIRVPISRRYWCVTVRCEIFPHQGFDGCYTLSHSQNWQAMATQFSDFIGCGSYTLSDAARLTGMRRQRLKRWVCGYEYRRGEQIRSSPAVRNPELPTVDDEILLSFADLIEVRFINAFLNRGISLRKIRIVSDSAAVLVKSSHPFSSKRFKTDGRTIFLHEVVEQTGEEWLLDLLKNQYAFKQVVWQSLYKGLEYDSDEDVRRWFPMFPKRRIVIDPRRRFGGPITDRGGIPTATLADAVESEGSVDRVAKWYELARSDVADAVAFENSLTA